MHYLIAALYFLLALIGSDGWGDRTVVTRASLPSSWQSLVNTA